MTIFLLLQNYYFLAIIFFCIVIGVWYILIKNSLKIEENNANFKKFFETIDDLVIVGDKQGHIVYTNSAVSQKLGYSPEELLTMQVLDLNPKNQRREAEEILKKMLAGTQDSCPLPLEGKNGVLLPAETRVWFGKWDKKDCIFGLSKDLSLEQEALQKFNKVFYNNPAPMAISALEDQRFIDVNEMFLLKMGYSREEIIGKTSEELDLFIRPEKQQDTANKLVREGHILNTELKLKTKKGEILDGLFSGEIIQSQGKKYFLTVMIDQTESKRAEKKMLENKQRLESILEGTQVGTWEWNVQTGETIFNEKWAQIIGYTLEELAPISIKTWEKYTNLEDLKKSDEFLKLHFLGKLPYYDCEVRMIHKNGKEIWVHDKGRVITRDNNGMPLMMYGTHEDISKRKLAEREIKKNLAQQELLSEISIDLNQYENFHTTMNDVLRKIAIHTKSGRSYIFEDSIDGKTTSNTYEWCAKNIEPQINRLQNILYSTIPSFATAFRETGMLQADDVSKLSPELRAVLEPQGIKSILIIPLKIKGKQFGFIGFDQTEKNIEWSQVDVHLLWILSNSISSIYEKRNNTIEIQEKINLIRKENNEIETIIKDVEDGVFVIDVESKITLFNHKARKISGYSIEDVLNKPYFEMLHFMFEKSGEKNDQFIERAMIGGKSQDSRGETILMTKDGSAIGVNSSASPLKDEKGHIVGCVVVFRDVTKEREVDKMKSEFISIASHQLKTPLAGIKWLSELLLGTKIGDISDKQKKYLMYIHFSNERMLKLIDDLLNVSQIEDGEGYVINKEKIDVLALINEVIDDNQPLIVEKNISVVVNKNTPLKIEINGDCKKLKQVLNNLISNAVKYSEKSKNIAIRYTKENGKVIFEIEDQGIGIPKQQQERIFGKYFRADNAIIKETDGTGLGVYIAKRIIEAHGGTIWFESVEKVGSTFCFSLPSY